MNPLLTIPLDDLHKTAANRPPGYAERVLAAAEAVDPVHYHIRYDKWADLYREFRPGEKPPPRPFWQALHSATNPTPAEFEGLAQELPDHRRKQLDHYVTIHPVRWDDFPAWAGEFHDWITVTVLGKPKWVSAG